MIQRRLSSYEDMPISLVEAREAIRIEGSEDDTHIQTLIAAATSAISGASGRVLGPEKWSVSIPSTYGGWLLLPKSPIRSVDAVSYRDAAGDEWESDLAKYMVVIGDDHAWIKPRNAWPSAADRPDAVSIKFTAGYDECPATLKHAIRLMVAHLYDHPAASEAPLQEVPLGVRFFVEQERVGWVGA